MKCSISFPMRQNRRQKTIFDPSVYPNMPDMASSAASKALVQYQLTGESAPAVVVNGVKFSVPMKIVMANRMFQQLFR